MTPADRLAEVDIDALVENLLYEITPYHASTPERRERVRAVLREAGVKVPNE